MVQNKQAIYLFTLTHYKEIVAKQNKNYLHIANCEEVNGDFKTSQNPLSQNQQV